MKHRTTRRTATTIAALGIAGVFLADPAGADHCDGHECEVAEAVEWCLDDGAKHEGAAHEKQDGADTEAGAHGATKVEADAKARATAKAGAHVAAGAQVRATGESGSRSGGEVVVQEAADDTTDVTVETETETDTDRGAAPHAGDRSATTGSEADTGAAAGEGTDVHLVAGEGVTAETGIEATVQQGAAAQAELAMATPSTGEVLSASASAPASASTASSGRAAAATTAATAATTGALAATGFDVELLVLVAIVALLLGIPMVLLRRTA